MNKTLQDVVLLELILLLCSAVPQAAFHHDIIDYFLITRCILLCFITYFYYKHDVGYFLITEKRWSSVFFFKVSNFTSRDV